MTTSLSTNKVLLVLVSTDLYYLSFESTIKLTTQLVPVSIFERPAGLNYAFSVTDMNFLLYSFSKNFYIKKSPREKNANAINKLIIK